LHVARAKGTSFALDEPRKLQALRAQSLLDGRPHVDAGGLRTDHSHERIPRCLEPQCLRFALPWSGLQQVIDMSPRVGDWSELQHLR